jgi:hypothetical protein
MRSELFESVLSEAKPTPTPRKKFQAAKPTKDGQYKVLTSVKAAVKSKDAAALEALADDPSLFPYQKSAVKKLIGELKGDADDGMIRHYLNQLD